MNTKALFLIIFQIFIIQNMFSQSIVGTWKTIDDETGEARSYVEIFEKGGKFFGKITKLLDSPVNSVCEKCEGSKKNQPIIGLEIISNMKPYDDYWSYGQVLDPESGSEYKCNISLDGNDKLKLRGYVGFPALGRTQIWHRVK